MIPKKIPNSCLSNLTLMASPTRATIIKTILIRYCLKADFNVICTAPFSIWITLKQYRQRIVGQPPLRSIRTLQVGHIFVFGFSSKIFHGINSSLISSGKNSWWHFEQIHFLIFVHIPSTIVFISKTSQMVLQSGTGHHVRLGSVAITWLSFRLKKRS